MIAPTTQTLERAVRQWVAAGTALPTPAVIPGKQKGAAPTGEAYATVTHIVSLSEGHAWDRQTFNAGARAVESRSFQNIEARYSVTFFRKGANDLAAAFRLWAYTPTGNREAARRRLTFIRADDVRNADNVVSGEWEERAGLDIVVGYVAREENVHDIGLIEEVDISINEDAPFTVRCPVEP